MVISTVVSRRRSVLPFGQRKKPATPSDAPSPAAVNDLDPDSLPPVSSAQQKEAEAATNTYDSTVPLGILRNEKRFNVALSRAKCLTIVGKQHSADGTSEIEVFG